MQYSASLKLNSSIFFLGGEGGNEFGNKGCKICHMILCLSFSCNYIGYFKQALKSDWLFCLGLEQHVDEPTHRHRHTLDLTVTRMSECLVLHTPVVDQFISDHATVLCWLTLPRPALSMKTSSYRKIKSIDMEQLKRD